nr:unnamed protein product [Callosobruchus analis]
MEQMLSRVCMEDYKP